MPGDEAIEVTPEQLRVLASWAPRLERLESAGAWRGGERDAAGVITMPWFELSPEIDAFVSEVAAAGFVRPLDWGAWSATPEARRLIDDPTAIADAPAADLVRLLTTIVRGERFSDGELEAAADRGTLLAIARRAEALLA